MEKNNDNYTISYNLSEAENNSIIVSGGLCDIQATLQVQDYLANLQKN